MAIKREPVRSGHYRAVTLLEDVAAVRSTLLLYREAMKQPHGIYLRPTDGSFTVLSLDHERCRSMVGVGSIYGFEHKLGQLPPDVGYVERAVKGYEAKLATMRRGSREEVHALRVVSAAVANGLLMPKFGAYFVNQEWRFHLGGRLDILGAEPHSGRLVVIELKSSKRDAELVDTHKGGNAWQQAERYADRLFQDRELFYPFFERLARAMARVYGADEAMQQIRLDMNQRPDIRVAWP